MTDSTSGHHERPSGGVELVAWLFMRFSGVLLLFLALGHLFIMHVINSIHEIDYDFVAAILLSIIALIMVAEILSTRVRATFQ